MRANAETEERRRQAYETTKTDEEAANLLQMNVLTFKSWRTSRRFPIKNPKPGLEPTAEELETVRRMYSEGASFEVIAAHINEHRVGNRKWLKTPGSVAWNAFKLGIITKDQLDHWYEGARRRKIAARAKGRDSFRSGVLLRDGNRCVTCGGRNQLEVDHIIELWKGGPNLPPNGVTLCRACHKRKTSPGDDASWHSFAKRYAKVVARLGFRVEYGMCPDHQHHYLIVRTITTDASHQNSAGSPL